MDQSKIGTSYLGRPLRLAGSGGVASPMAESFVPSAFQSPAGVTNTVWVDFAGGNDTDALNATSNGTNFAGSAYAPFLSFVTAWNYTVVQANQNSGNHYVIRLKNTDGVYIYPSGSPTIRNLPRYPNVTVKGDGTNITVFEHSDDNLSFYLDTNNQAYQFYLNFEDLTLANLNVRVDDAAANTPGTNLSQPSYIRGNGTTGILYSLGVYGGAAGKGASVSDGGTASSGGLGGGISNLMLDGFVAKGITGSQLNIVAGRGGDGGDANVFSAGEYGDQEAYGTCGNGGDPGYVDKVLIRNFKAHPYSDGSQPPNLSGWNMTVQQGAYGAGGVDKGGSMDGNPSFSSGNTIPGTTAQKLAIVDSDVLNLSTYPDSAPADGRATVEMLNCYIGFTGTITRTLCVYTLTAVGGAISPAVTIQASSSSTLTWCPTLDLFV